MFRINSFSILFRFASVAFILICSAGQHISANVTTAVADEVLITVSATFEGNSPTRIGYGINNPMQDGTNLFEFLRYSGTNVARCGYVSNTAYNYNNSADPTPWGDGVTSIQTFLSNRAIVRANPESNGLIQWPFFLNRFKTILSNGSTFDFQLQKLKELKLDVLFLMNRYTDFAPYRTNNSDRWGDKWEEWLNRYVYAFHAAKDYNVSNFELYNEPHIYRASFGIGVDEFIERMQIGSDAVQCAVADVNKLYGKNLVANVTGPVTHGEQFWAVPGGDTRDDLIGWGEATIKNLHTTFESKADNSFSLVNSYCYHLYSNGRTIPQVAGAVDYNRQQIKSILGYSLPIWISEWNVNTNDMFSTLSETMDSPKKFSEFAATLGAYNETGVENLLPFQFGMGQFGAISLESKNGMHYMSKTTPVNVGGLSRSAEIMHLFAPAFTNKLKYVKPTAVGVGADSIFVTTSSNLSAGYRYVWVTNRSSKSVPLRINLSQWASPTITGYFIQEVGISSFGEVKTWNTLPSSEIVDVIPAYSTWLVSLFSGVVLKQADIKASEDAMVTGGSSSTKNSGTSKILDISNHTTESINRNVTFIKFPLSGISSNDVVKRALLRVAAQKVTHLSTSPINNRDLYVVHVYGLTDDNWTENSITWDTAPNLLKNSLLGGNDFRVDSIKDNYVSGVGTTAKFLGHITASENVMTERTLDITDFVSTQTDGFATIMLVREVRSDEDILLPNRIDDVWRMRIQSKENTSGYLSPTLSVFTENNIAGIQSPLNSNINLNLFPNPSKQNLHINYNLNESENVDISLINLTGNNVMQVCNMKQEAGIHKHTLDISNLVSGVYFVNVRVNGSSLVRKFMKQ